jgi:hypothetical protein
VNDFLTSVLLEFKRQIVLTGTGEFAFISPK